MLPAFLLNGESWTYEASSGGEKLLRPTPFTYAEMMMSTEDVSPRRPSHYSEGFGNTLVETE